MEEKKQASQQIFRNINFYPHAREGHKFGWVIGSKIHTAPTLEAVITLRNELRAAKRQEEQAQHEATP